MADCELILSGPPTTTQKTILLLYFLMLIHFLFLSTEDTEGKAYFIALSFLFSITYLICGLSN